MRHPLYLIVLLAALGGCVRPPDRIDFDASPYIFRGIYQAEADLRLASPDVALSADGSFLAMAGGDGLHAVQFWDVTTGKPIGGLGKGVSGFSVVMTPDGSRVATSIYSDSSRLNAPGEVRVWDVATKKPVYRLSGRSPSCARQCEPGPLAVSPDGTRLALVSSAFVSSETASYTVNEVSVFDLTTGERLLVLPGPQGEGVTVRFSPDGTRLVAASKTFTSRVRASVWELPGGRLLGTYERDTGDVFQVHTDAWQGGSPVIGVDYPDRVELITVDKGALIGSFPRPPGGQVHLEALHLTADNALVLANFTDYEQPEERYNQTLLWDLSRDSALGRVVGRQQTVGFSPGGRYALTYDETGLVVRNGMTLEAEKTLVNGEVVPLRVEATPTYTDPSRYRVEGTVRFGTATPVPFEGEVQGNDEQLYVQTPGSRPATLDMNFSYNGATWRFQAEQWSSLRTEGWEGMLLEATETVRGPLGYHVILEPWP